MNTNSRADLYVIHVLRSDENILFLVRGVSGVDLGPKYKLKSEREAV